MNLYASSVNTVQRIKNAITIAKLTFPIVERLERFPGIPSSVAMLGVGLGVEGLHYLGTIHQGNIDRG